MTYELYIGDRTFSSWSMRGWLLFRAFDIPVNVITVGLYSGTLKSDIAHLAPARLVPIVQTAQGHVIQDTLAIAETLAEAHPEKSMWPHDAGHRALARSITAEMHSGFGALRDACPMNLQNGWSGFPISQDVANDVQRIETLWNTARSQPGSDGWLFGDYSIADVFYAPIAARIAGYGIKVSDAAQRYVDQHLNHDLFRQWRAMGLTKTYDPFPYETTAKRVDWPGPIPITATAVDIGPSVNATCPYSGDPVTDFLQIEDRVFGFCNAFCRDKTLNDPAAWGDFMAIYQS